MKLLLFALAAGPLLFSACSTPRPTYAKRAAADHDGGDWYFEIPNSRYDGALAQLAKKSSPRSSRPQRSGSGTSKPLRHADPLELYRRPPPKEARPPLPVPGGSSIEESMTAENRAVQPATDPA